MKYLYRAFAADGTLLYIGQSCDPANRRSSHLANSQWAKDAHEWVISGPFATDQILALEAAAIFAEQPLHNVRHTFLPYNPRAKQVAPRITLGDLRAAVGLTLDEVCARVAETTGKPFFRGSLSAIENGIRGASAEVLSALETAYGIRSGSIDTQYEPRTRSAVA